MIIKAELDEIAAGLSTLDVLTLIKNHSIKTHPLLIAYHYQFMCDSMQDMFKINFSIAGLNQQQKEEETTMYWVNLLQDVECEFHCMYTLWMNIIIPVDNGGKDLELSLTVGDILAFATGASTTPSIGFSPQPPISFHDRSKYPEANTCSSVLRLSTLNESYIINIYSILDESDTFCFSVIMDLEKLDLFRLFCALVFVCVSIHLLTQYH